MALVLLFGLGATVATFLVVRTNVRNSERSLMRERTGQTFGVIRAVVQQVEAIVAAGVAAAEYTGGDAQAFEAATSARVERSLISNLSLIRFRSGDVVVVASVGSGPSLRLAGLTTPEKEKLADIARSGSNLRYVSRVSSPGRRSVEFAASPRAGSDLLIWGSITATDAEAQAGGVVLSDLRFAIYLGSRSTPATLLLSSPDGIPHGGNVVTDQIPIGDEQLLVSLGPRHRLVNGLTSARPWVVLGGGLLGTLLISALVERARRRRDQALQLVAHLEQRTRDLHQALAERRRAEEDASVAAEKFRRVQRMEAIGQLAGGVAHDFNNLLTAIIGSTRLLLRETGAGDRFRSGLEDIERAADRAATLTRQLLAFSRKQLLQPTVVDLNSIVQEMGTLLRHLIRADIRLVTALEPRLAAVEADANQIEQVIINLVVNASDAIEGSGTITIATANEDFDTDAAGDRPTPGRYAVLSVSDDGFGMDEKTRERLFEPFFTTKGLGRGTGLGLATVYGIVEQSGGSIEVESKPGCGAVFRILLPAVDKEVEKPPPDSDHSESTFGTETVVVAEDDDMVRALVRITLERNGYSVLEAASGEGALEVCERHSGPVHALVTDMVMPGMGGRALADRLTAQRPELRVLYVSGYAEVEVLDRDSSGLETSFVQKPFTPEQLARGLRALIDRPRPDAERLSS